MSDERAPIPTRHLRDPHELRALAHPLRMELIERLALGGALTASELAEATGESPANCSWHLRQLEKFGFVEEAERGPGRRRPWRLVLASHSWGAADQPDLDAAGKALSDLVLEREVSALRSYRQVETKEPTTWREAAFTSHSYAWLTPEELAEIGDVVTELVLRHVDRFVDPDRRPPGSRPVRVVAWGIPAAP